MEMLNFSTTRDEALAIHKITKRALTIAKEQGYRIDGLEMDMDITACHLNGCALDLGALADAPNFDFAHDVFGIRRHINRTTGQLEDCFLPRYATNIEARRKA
jgi:hypothetical protein